jgi:hypothetical protein
MTPVGGNVPIGGIMPPGIPGVIPPGGLRIGGKRGGNRMLGGNVIPPFWFCLSI